MPLTREEADRAVEKLRFYAQPQRLMILSHLQAGEMTVSEIDSVTGIGQPALSQQLGELRRAARQVFYRLADAGVALCVRSIEAQFGRGETGSLPAPPEEMRPPEGPRSPGAALFGRLLRPRGSPA
jgi:hypothetical protein